MDHYSHADRTALTRAVEWLLGRCDCHGSAGRGPGGPTACRPASDTARLRLDDNTTFCAFEQGSSLKVHPTGQVEYHRAVQTARRGGCALRHVVPESAFMEPHMSRLDVNPMTTKLEGRAPEAPLPAAFRVCRLGNGKTASAQFLVPVAGRDGIESKMEARQVDSVCEGNMRIPWSAFVSSVAPSPMDIERDLGPTIEAHEDAMCLRQLDGLGRVDETYTYRWNSTLEELARFVSGLNATRPRALRFDTVLVNLNMYMTLFGNDRRTPSWNIGYPFYGGDLLYQNMTVLGKMAFLHHPGVPHDEAYALSAAQGPVFAHGPSIIDSTSDGLDVARHCGLVEPPPGLPGCPWGVRFGVCRDRAADNEWPEDTE
ncbi:MAG: hypothetical protein OXU37_04325 [Thaumarchaeota archaeon]|nr:hypothetical protein [Nitrososphaerota archaeon]